MTAGEARRKAKRLWGSDGWAWESAVGTMASPPLGRFKVGVFRNGGPTRFGDGGSFEAAFLDAEARDGNKRGQEGQHSA